MSVDLGPVSRPHAPALEISPVLTVQPPLSRRGHGPGLILLVDGSLDLSKHDKTLDPPPLQKWAEEGYAVAQLVLKEPGSHLGASDLRKVIAALASLPSCDQSEKLGVVAYLADVSSSVGACIDTCDEVRGVVYYGAHPASSVKPMLVHRPGAGPAGRAAGEGGGLPAQAREHRYPQAASAFFAVPAHAGYHGGAAAVAHTRCLQFLKPLLGGPYFDLEAIWEEHTYWEFEARDVAQTMATMVEEPYVNHIPTLTGGVGREKLTHFYTNHFVFANPPDTELELVSRTTGIDRVVDEFLFKFTHDRVIDWLAPGVPPTGKHVAVPFTSVVNLRGDRLYHEHISWDQATLLRQLGLLPDYLPFPYPHAGARAGQAYEYRLPVAGVESARKLADESAEGSNAMFAYAVREAPRE